MNFKKVRNLAASFLLFVFTLTAPGVAHAEDLRLLSPETTAAAETSSVLWPALDDAGALLQREMVPALQTSSVSNLVEPQVLSSTYTSATTAIVNALANMAPSVSLTTYGIPRAEIGELFFSILNDHPEFFYVKGSISYTIDSVKGTIKTLVPSYTKTADQVASMRYLFEEEVTKALSVITPGMTDVEKALAIHDYLILNTRYDMNSTILPDSYNAYGVLVDNLAVCNGYALAYKYLMENRLGIPTELVVSNAMNHAWNLITIGGQNYHVDVTWDDPVWDRLGNVGHDYFLLSDAAISAGTNPHYSWTVAGTAPSTTYDNMFWKNVDSRFVVDSGNWYYMSTAGKLMKYSAINGTQTTVYTLPSGSYKSGVSLKLDEKNGKLFFHTDSSILSMNKDGSGLSTAFVPSAGLGAIQGLAFLDGALKYTQRSSYYTNSWENLYEAPVVTAPPVTGVQYRTHIQNIGWQAFKANGETSGTSGLSLRLEGIEIRLGNMPNLGIRYSTHVQDYGWQGYVQDGAVSGTVGQAKRLEAIKIELTGADKDKYDIFYRVHVQNLGWLDWAKNGHAAGSAGYSYRLEAIEIKILEKGQGSSLPQANPYTSFYGDGLTNYSTHVQDFGWQNTVTDGAVSGTTGLSKRLEGITLKLGSSLPSGSVVYSTHVQDYGWMGEVSDGALSGTTGQAKRLEAIRIRLTGTVAEQYDIYYRVHAEMFGWMGWAKNGQDAGTAGYSYRLEAIQICLVPKGAPAPGSTANAFTAKVVK